MFRNLLIKRFYRSKVDEIDKDFLIPLLGRSKEYDRGTGYFSLGALASIAEGLIPFIKNGGNIRIVTSVDLDIEERSIIQKGLALSEDNVIDVINKQIQFQLEESDILKLDLITNLIAAKRLVVKIAYMPKGGIYHEKIGFLKDFNNDIVYFNGSSNETYYGYKKNLESITVLKSWDGDNEDIEQEKQYFENLWYNKINEICVLEFPEALKDEIFTKYKVSTDLSEAILKLEESFYEAQQHPKKKELFPYQKKAIQEFIDNGYKHFYEMATGTGKTYTAIKTIEKLHEIFKNIFVVVLVPQVDLQDQWRKSLNENGLNSYLFGGLSKDKDWEEVYNECVIDYYNNEDIVILISTYETYFTKLYTEVNSLNINKMILIDEAHELSANQIGKLSTSFALRLGLSATPERHNIEETNKIINYFTAERVETYKYTIDEAIKNKFLSKYNYYPLLVNLDTHEFELYQNYTKKLIYLLSQKEKDINQITEVSNNRSIVVKKANSKIVKFAEMCESRQYNFCNSVVYCGQGKDYLYEENIIDIVTRLLSGGHYRVSQFTSKTIDRTKVLVEFENGYYDTLIAIRCFDQGVDVPKLDKIYIMASDSLNRQTIQRRGRVLRQCKESGKEMAYIYDMVVLPPDGIFAGIGSKSLIVNEFRRVKEYMRLAENYEDVYNSVKDIETIFGIMEEDYGIEE